MSLEHKDRIIESLLEEVLGGKRPPDLTDRIMQRLADTESGEADSSNTELSPLPSFDDDPAREYRSNRERDEGLIQDRTSRVPIHVDLPPMVPGVEPAPIVQLPAHELIAVKRHKTIRRDRSSVYWMSAMFVAGAAACGAVVYFGASQGLFPFLTDQQSQIAKQSDSKGEETKSVAGDSSRTTDSNGVSPFDPGNSFTNRRQIAQSMLGKGTSPQFKQELGVNPATAIPLPTKAISVSTPVLPAALSDQKVVGSINERIQHVWKSNGLDSLASVSDEVFCDRTFLTVLGRSPTAEELSEFMATDIAERRADLAWQLTTSPKYQETFANHWSKLLLSSWLPGIPANIRDVRVERLAEYFKQSLIQQKPYDKIVRDLITASGKTEPSADNYNPATNFWAVLADGQQSLVTSSITRNTLGVRMDCAQCHELSETHLAQRDFWQVNSYLRALDATAMGTELALFDNRVNVMAGNVTISYPRRDNTVEASSPTVSSEWFEAAPRDLPVAQLREFLATTLTSNDRFRRTSANQVWGFVFGYGLCNPIGDFGDHNPVLDEPLLKEISDQFAAHEYQLPNLVRWLVLSQPFSVPEESSLVMDDPAVHGTPLFSRYYNKGQLPAVTLDSLAIVMKAYQSPGRSGGAKLAVLASVQPRGKAPTATLNGPKVAPQISLPSEAMDSWGTHEKYSALLNRISSAKIPIEEKASHIFMLATGRAHTAQELELAVSILKSNPDDSRACLQDIWWSLTQR
jgi:Protein of unknown function (DUF1549)/Protein of unknown function (DUF1553)